MGIPSVEEPATEELPSRLHQMRDQIARKYMDKFSDKERARQQDLRDNPPEDLLVEEEEIPGNH